MADKRTHNATLMSKQLGQFVTESQAAAMASKQGGHTMLIIDARHGQLITNEDGTQLIKLTADQVEMVPDEHAETVREFQRALYLARPEQHGQAAFEGASEGEPTVEQTAAALDAKVDRDEEGKVKGVWDGDPDAPVVNDKGQAKVKLPPAAKGKGLTSVPDPAPEKCPTPDCVLPSEHDGDHQLADGIDA